MAISRFRENPTRAIYVIGEINQSMIDRLTPEILQLRAQSAEAITVYIDSPGGSTFHAHLLLHLLTTSNQDGQRYRIVTVVTGTAASAAADILAAGDYSIAYPHTVVHYHGVRTSSGDITHESASSLVEALKQTNEGFALELAERIKRRFFFIYSQLSSEQRAMRERNSATTAVECFSECVSKKLGSSAKLLNVALVKQKRLNSLLAEYNAELQNHSGAFPRPADKEAFLIKFLVDWELKENTSPQWRFGSKGLGALREDFVLLADFEDGQHMRNLDRDIDEWGMFLLEEDEQPKFIELSKNSPEDSREFVRIRTKDTFRALWHFLVSVCRALQQGENRLTPWEAYWLGLVDEIPGSGLANLREVFEKFPEVVEAERAAKKSGKLRSIAAKGVTRRPKKTAAKRNKK